MRYLRIIPVVAILSALALCGQAMTVQPVIDPGFLWDDGGTLKIRKGLNFAVDIEMDNPEPFSRSGFQMTLIFYGTDGVENWALVDIQGDIIPNIVMTNGFEYYPYPNPWFPFLDTFFVASYNGTGSDTAIFVTSGIAGMPGGEPLLKRLRFWFRVDQEGTFCVDSGGYECCWDPPFPWPPWCFDDGPSPSFNGPHCWEVGEPSTYVCGDANFDQAINLLDIGYLIDFLYRNGPPPFPSGAGDTNADGEINLLDAANLINYLYKNGPAPLCP